MNKYANPGCIDVKAMYAAEKKKREQSTRVNQISREAVFNILQDMRHLLIIDTRTPEEFSKSHIRNSWSLQLEENKEVETDFMKFCKKSQDKLVDPGDLHRRLLIITDDEQSDITQIRKILEGIQAFHKIMQLKSGFQDFYDKYSFLCVSDSSTNDDIQRAGSRYPSEIIPGKLFLGNFINSMNETHFVNLGIKKLIGMTPNPAEKIGESEQITKYIHLEMSEVHKKLELDFEELSQLVRTTMEEEDGAVLIY